MTESNKKDWEKKVAEELDGEPIDSLIWETLEGIDVKPLYTADDLEEISHLDSFPGLPPYVRGHKATMYAKRPWTVRHY